MRVERVRALGALSAAGVAFAAAVAARAQIDPWLFGALLLIAWALLAYALRVFAVARPLWILLTATSLALVMVIWNRAAPQPRVHVDAVRLQTFPSTASPGVLDLALRNSGAVRAQVVVFPVAYLGPEFRNARELAAGGVEAELLGRLGRAAPLPAEGTMTIPAGQTARLDVEIPPSKHSWFIGRGATTLLVAARLRYRDRGLTRETVFCLFANPPSGRWLSCPFLNE